MRLKRNHNSVWLRGFVVVLLGAALAFAAAACGDDDDDATPTTGNTKPPLGDGKTKTVARLRGGARAAVGT